MLRPFALLVAGLLTACGGRIAPSSEDTATTTAGTPAATPVDECQTDRDCRSENEQGLCGYWLRGGCATRKRCLYSCSTQTVMARTCNGNRPVRVSPCGSSDEPLTGTRDCLTDGG